MPFKKYLLNQSLLGNFGIGCTCKLYSGQSLLMSTILSPGLLMRVPGTWVQKANPAQLSVVSKYWLLGFFQNAWLFCVRVLVGNWIWGWLCIQHVWQSEDNLWWHPGAPLPVIIYLSIYLFVCLFRQDLLFAWKFTTLSRIVGQGASRNLSGFFPLCLPPSLPHYHHYVGTVGFQVVNHCAWLLKLVLGVWTQDAGPCISKASTSPTEPFSSMGP